MGCAERWRGCDRDGERARHGKVVSGALNGQHGLPCFTQRHTGQRSGRQPDSPAGCFREPARGIGGEHRGSKRQRGINRLGEFGDKVVANFHIKVKNLFQTAALLRQKHLLRRHVNRFDGETGVHHDHGKDSHGSGVDLRDATVHRGCLGPNRHGVARPVVFRCDERVLNDGRGDRQRDVHRIAGLERARGR